MSKSQITSLICNNFGGIRRKESSFSDDKITCSDCQNVELFFTGLNSGVGVRTAKGNLSVKEFTGEEVIGLFLSNQGGEDVIIAYTEDDDYGYLYACNIFTSSYDKLATLTKTGKACGTDFEQGWLDMFIFSNGEDIVYLYTDTNNNQGIQVETQSFSNEKLYTISSSTATEVQNANASATNGKLTATISGDDVTLYRLKSSDTILEEDDVKVNYYAWSDGTNTYYTKTGMNVILYDVYNREINGLGMVVFDKRLWIFNGSVLWYSQQGECRDFRYVDTEAITSSGSIEFVKPITAIYPYLGSLAVFHKDSSCLVTVDSTTGFKHEDESPGGCASYNSLVFHGTDLYFYDDTKKGVFGFSQVVNGDKVLSQNIAEDIQQELIQIQASDVDSIRTLSVVTEDRNEVWFIVPISDKTNRTVILIFDYIRGEWIKRLSNKINCLLVYNADLYSGGAKLYKEYTTNTFDGDFIEAFYKCSIFNYGTDNTLKITKFPPRLTVNIGDGTNFWIEYRRNYDITREPKTKNVKSKSSNKFLVYDENLCYDSGYIYTMDVNAIVKLPSVTFKALEMTFRTETEGQGFGIKNIEFSKLKVKQV